MKKHLYTILITISCIIFVLLNLQKPMQYKVLEVKSSDTVCIDFNDNEKCGKNEFVKIYGVTAFPEKFGSKTKYIEERYGIKETDSVVLGVLTKDFIENNLLNKYVQADVLTQTGNNIQAKIKYNNADFAQTLLKNGWGLSSNNDEYKVYENLNAVKNNIKFSKKFNFQLKNRKSGKIHTLECEYGRKAKDYEIGIFDDEKDKINYSKDCHEIKTSSKTVKAENFDYISDDIKIYFLDFTHNLKPDSSCSKEACQILLSSINNAKTSIDFAIYGFGNIPKVEEALKKASQRGVKIRYVVDEDAYGNNIYEKTQNLKKILPEYKTDFIEGEPKKFNNFIMHNKFFIFDNNSVWLGSANISETDLSGYNANNVIYIKSEQLANIYKTEFEKMFKGKFHTKKSKNQIKEFNIKNTSLKAAFSPEDDVITNYLIPLINNAQKSIYIETFILTHKGLAESLIEAKKRNVDIKIIVDATNVSSSYSMIKQLRDNDIQVKTENYAGKMHMKTVLIDGKYFIAGSMNLTKSGEKYNDENMLFITNSEITKNATKFFNYIWSQIPEKYLTKNPPAESKASTGACYDGIDNDYDGKTDKSDEGCR